MAKQSQLDRAIAALESDVSEKQQEIAVLQSAIVRLKNQRHAQPKKSRKTKTALLDAVSEDRSA